MKPAWVRKGLYYHAYTEWKVGNYIYVSNKTLFFIAYWMIHWYHGPIKLEEMASEITITL